MNDEQLEQIPTLEDFIKDVECYLEKEWMSDYEKKKKKDYRDNLLKDYPEFIEWLDGAPLFKEEIL